MQAGEQLPLGTACHACNCPLPWRSLHLPSCGSPGPAISGPVPVYVSAIEGLPPIFNKKNECTSVKAISKEFKARQSSTKLASPSREITEETPTEQNHSKETDLTVYGERFGLIPVGCPLLWTCAEINIVATCF